MPTSSSSAAASTPASQESTNSIPQHSVDVLRVAQQELSSGNRSGQVFCQLSPGAVAFAVDRPVLQARVSRLLHQAIEKDSV